MTTRAGCTHAVPLHSNPAEATWRTPANDAQTWTLIGGFLTIVTFMSALLLKIVDTKIEALGNRVDGHIDGAFERLNGRINVLGEKVDNIDRDVQAITAHLWGTGQQ